MRTIRRVADVCFPPIAELPRVSAFVPSRTFVETTFATVHWKRRLHRSRAWCDKAHMEQDDLTPAARQLLQGTERLKSERLKTVQAKSEKLRAAMEARGGANDER